MHAYEGRNMQAGVDMSNSCAGASSSLHHVHVQRTSPATNDEDGNATSCCDNAHAASNDGSVPDTSVSERPLASFFRPKDIGVKMLEGELFHVGTFGSTRRAEAALAPQSGDDDLLAQASPLQLGARGDAVVAHAAAHESAGGAVVPAATTAMVAGDTATTDSADAHADSSSTRANALVVVNAQDVLAEGAHHSAGDDCASARAEMALSSMHGEAGHPLLSRQPVADAARGCRSGETVARNFARLTPPDTTSPSLAHGTVLLRFAFFLTGHRKVEFVVHEGQTLLELRNVLKCAATRRINFQASEVVRISSVAAEDLPTDSAMFFIEDKFYVSGPEDYAQPILQWFSARSTSTQPAVLKMEEVTLADLQLRLGKQYLFVHHGSCEHTLVVTSCWLAGRQDAHAAAQYPLLVWQARERPKRCSVCRAKAYWEVHNDDRADAPRCLLCYTCRFEWHYSRALNDGRGQALRRDYRAYRFID